MLGFIIDNTTCSISSSGKNIPDRFKFKLSSIFASCHLDSFINSIAAGATENATERYKQWNETESRKSTWDSLPICFREHGFSLL